jgi:hypothetical protein
MSTVTTADGDGAGPRPRSAPRPRPHAATIELLQFFRSATAVVFIFASR